MRHLLILEPESTGHRLDHCSHFLHYFLRRLPSFTMTFVGPPELVGPLRETSLSQTTNPVDSPSFVEMTSSECSSCAGGSLARRSFGVWRTMMKYLAVTGADHGHFLHIDLVQPQLAMTLSVPPKRTLSGVLFRPSVHYRCMFGDRRGFRELLRDKTKSIVYRRMLQHTGLTHVFSLDPYFAEYAARTYANGSKVVPLPDPGLFPGTPTPGGTLDAFATRFPNDRTLFLLFGVLARRKGIFETLDAILRLDVQTSRRSAIVFAGALAGDVQSEFKARFRSTKAANPHIWMHLEARHLTSEECVALVDRCDVVLAPYNRFVGSSGILFWAASACKPLITQKYGYLGAVTERWGLGTTVDTRDPQAIARAMRLYAHDPTLSTVDAEQIRSRMERHSAWNFADTIVGTLAGN